MIARGGIGFVIAPALVIALLMLIGVTLASYPAVLLTIPIGIVFLIMLVFFRDPPRVIGQGIVSPADGKVIEANRKIRKVVIYMGLRDVHVNRAPWSGVVRDQKRHYGGHAVASSYAAADNSALIWQIETLLGPLSLKQITGAVARRIVPYVDEGARIKKGQRIGLIRFGSRVEVVLPSKARLVVKAGDRVRAGETTIAEVAHAS